MQSKHFSTQAAEEAIFTRSPTPWCRVSKEGNFLSANKAMVRLFGWTEADLLGFNWRHITRATDIKSEDLEMLRVISGDQRSFEMEKEYEGKDGRFFWAWVTVNGVYDDDGNLVEFIKWVIPVQKAKVWTSFIPALVKYKKVCAGFLALFTGLGLVISGDIKFADLISFLPKLFGF